MYSTQSLVHLVPYSNRVTTTASHPQLRDLLAFNPPAFAPFASTGAANSITTTTHDSLANHSLWNDRAPVYTPLPFTPCCLAQGHGIVAVGGQQSEILIKSVDPNQTWSHEHVPRDIPAGGGGSIVNAISISPLDEPSCSSRRLRLLVSSNDEAIKVFDIVGDVPDSESAYRVRTNRLGRRFRAPPREPASTSRDAYLSPSNNRGDSGTEEDEDDEVEESTSFDRGGECQIVPRPELDLRDLSTPINQCSLSRDGRRLVAVGDTDQVFLFDVVNGGGREGQYRLRQVIDGAGTRADASFSTDWDQEHCFVVGSQDGYVTVYDQRQLPSASGTGTGSSLASCRSSPRSRRIVAEFESSQRLRGPAGAVRKVKFSPGGRGEIESGLLAFTEHRNRVQLIDSRTFEHHQVVEIPNSSNAGTYHSQLSAAARQPRTIRTSPTAMVHAVTLGIGASSSEGFMLRNRPQPRQFRSSRTRANQATNNATVSATTAGGGMTTRTRVRDDHDRTRPRPRSSPDRSTTTTTTRARQVVMMEMPDEGRGQVWPTPVVGEEEEGDPVDRSAPPASRYLTATVAQRRAGSPDEVEVSWDWDDGASAHRSDGETEGDRAETFDDARMEIEERQDRATDATDRAFRDDVDDDADGRVEEEEEDDDSECDEEEGDDDDSEDDGEEGGSRSTLSSVNTTRPRRFGQHRAITFEGEFFDDRAPGRQSYSSAAASALSVHAAASSTINQDDPARNVPYTTLTRYSYSPNSTSSDRVSLSLFAAPLLDNNERPPTPPTLTFYPSPSRIPPPPPPRVYPFSTATFAYSSPNLVAASSAQPSYNYAMPPSPFQAYYRASPASNNFPLDESEFDVLGMDWDEFGERLLVATATRVWEWDVDKDSRRCRGTFGFM
ncbi:hypothetical protein JCM3766R1_002475 [Sporobolomyces carnicolor]